MKANQRTGSRREMAGRKLAARRIAQASHGAGAVLKMAWPGGRSGYLNKADDVSTQYEII